MTIISDGNQSYAIWLGPDNTTSDTQYRYLNPDDVVVVNIDDETAGYSISAIDEYSSESGDNASFRVRTEQRTDGQCHPDPGQS